MTRQQAVTFLIDHPAKFAHMLGFDKLTDLHNDWIRDMLLGKDDTTLQAHRGSYKTTCVSVCLCLLIILRPNDKTLFMRKTDDGVKEIVRQVQKMLEDPHTQYFVQCIYGVSLKMNTQSVTEITTNLTTDPRGTAQLVARGCGSALTNKHFERIFTDDIVNADDRTSKAKREETKRTYQELQNVKNKGGRIYNTGTPWHPDDCFCLMPEPKKYDCYSTGIMTEDEIEDRRSKMLRSLFAVNYELKHIASEDVIFTDRPIGAERELVLNGVMHVDSAFYGEDYTALSVMAVHDGTYYIYGRLWRKHVEDCYEDIKQCYSDFLCGKMYMETNADKGMVAKELKREGLRVVKYHENMNKYVKIVTYLKGIWGNVVFVDGTDDEYISQIYDYNENADHDDAPDSAACLARVFHNKTTEYTPIYM